MCKNVLSYKAPVYQDLIVFCVHIYLFREIRFYLHVDAHIFIFKRERRIYYNALVLQNACVPPSQVNFCEWCDSGQIDLIKWGGEGFVTMGQILPSLHSQNSHWDKDGRVWHIPWENQETIPNPPEVVKILQAESELVG